MNITAAMMQKFLLSWYVLIAGTSLGPFLVPGFIIPKIPTHEIARRRSFLHSNDVDPTTFTVQYGNAMEAKVPIAANETLLAAMERIPALQGYIPHDCRKGTCMTCAARVVTENEAAVLETNDGMSPSISLDRQYILPCSTVIRVNSTAAASSVTLKLSEAHYDVWDEVYRQGLGHPNHSSAARAMRKHAERNVRSWIEQTEDVLQQTARSSALSSLDVEDKDDGALE